MQEAKQAIQANNEVRKLASHQHDQANKLIKYMIHNYK